MGGYLLLASAGQQQQQQQQNRRRKRLVRRCGCTCMASLVPRRGTSSRAAASLYISCTLCTAYTSTTCILTLHVYLCVQVRCTLQLAYETGTWRSVTETKSTRPRPGRTFVSGRIVPRGVVLVALEGQLRVEGSRLLGAVLCTRPVQSWASRLRVQQRARDCVQRQCGQERRPGVQLLQCISV